MGPLRCGPQRRPQILKTQANFGRRKVLLEDLRRRLSLDQTRPQPARLNPSKLKRVIERSEPRYVHAGTRQLRPRAPDLGVAMRRCSRAESNRSSALAVQRATAIEDPAVGHVGRGRATFERAALPQIDLDRDRNSLGPLRSNLQNEPIWTFDDYRGLLQVAHFRCLAERSGFVPLFRSDLASPTQRLIEGLIVRPLERLRCPVVPA